MTLALALAARWSGPLAFDPSDVVVYARVAVSVRILRIDGSRTASITGDNVCTSSFVKRF